MGSPAAPRAASSTRPPVHGVDRTATVWCVIVSVHMDINTGRTCAALHSAELQITAPTAGWMIRTPPDPHIRAIILAELYRHTVDGRPMWKLRAVNQGWTGGLASLASTHGVTID
jgi:stress response protein SCP2